MSRKFKRIISMALTLCMIFTLVQGLCITAQAAGTSVEIVSFVRGVSEGLRSSELLQAKVTGYDGDISELTFEWKNEVGTYLYVYNSSNMYNIKDTAGEVEIPGAVYILGIKLSNGDKHTGKGYAWASVYGAQLSLSSLLGEIEVTVKDKNGNVLGTDTCGGFKNPSLEEDLEDTRYGVFENEEINIKDMLGRSAIVHIDCSACSVDSAKTEDNDIIRLNQNENKEYIVKGLKSGEAQISLSLQKSNCKFHQNSGICTIENEIYVFKKPKTSTTTTTLTLTDIDPNCDYILGGVVGEVIDDKVVFENLTPDTTYEVTVRGDYGDGYAYAYVTDTTKPVFKATVNFYTDNKLSDTLKYFDADRNLFLVEKNSGAEYSLTKKEDAVGIYTAEVENGIYHIYYQNGALSRFGDYQLTIDNKNNELNVHTYSVRYDANGGNFGGTGGVYLAGDAVYVTETIPTREDHSFLLWKDNYGKEYMPGQLLTDDISKPYVLTAQWEKSVKVKVNVTIDHGQNHAINDDVSFRLIKIHENQSYPTANAETLSETNHDGYEYNKSGAVSTYIASSKTFDGEKDATYSVSCAKSEYKVASVTSVPDSDGNIVVNVNLVYAPGSFDIAFNVKMADDVPKYLYPAGANVQITYWGFDENNNLGWHIIEQHKDGTAVPVGINAQGEGTGSYPVWKMWSDNTTQPYYYRIAVKSYILADGTIVTSKDNAFISAVDIPENGGYPTYPNGSNPEYKGAFCDNGTQNGIPTATISIESYNLTFDAKGGLIKGNNTLTLKKQVVIPDTLEYVPVRKGGYVFDGWYTDEEYKEKADIGARLKGDTTLYAKWKEPLSIKGDVTVEGFYEDNNTTVNILPVDRAEKIVITLQIERNGTYNDYDSVSHELIYENNVAKVSYSFPEIADSGDKYRIRTTLINYETAYDNDGQGFSEDKYIALFNSSRDANIDALLTFKADDYNQKYIIDATEVGDAYRPQTGLTQILFQTTGSNPPNTLISQHTVAPGGEVLSFEKGEASGSINLWKGISNGAISSYQLKLKELDGIAYTDNSPYSVRYGTTTSWSVANNEAGILTAKIFPKEYTVKFDLNADGDSVGEMERFASDTGYFTIHKWSHDTEIDANPTREGYVFLGWEAPDGVDFDEEAQTVRGSVAEDITLTAKWGQYKWVTNTDTGYFNKEDGKKTAVVRFLFDVEAVDSIKGKITETGIKFIKSDDIGEKVDAAVVGNLTGTKTTFYGDIVNIPEEKAGTEYYAIAYLICDGKPIWSEPVACGPNFNDLIIYK